MILDVFLKENRLPASVFWQRLGFNNPIDLTQVFPEFINLKFVYVFLAYRNYSGPWLIVLGLVLNIRLFL